MDHTDQNFSDAIVALDGNRYFRCRFARCRLIYSGGEPPSFEGCTLTSSRFEFADAAARTLGLLSKFAETGSGFEQVFFDTFPAAEPKTSTGTPALPGPGTVVHNHYHPPSQPNALGSFLSNITGQIIAGVIVVALTAAAAVFLGA